MVSKMYRILYFGCAETRNQKLGVILIGEWTVKKKEQNDFQKGVEGKQGETSKEWFLSKKNLETIDSSLSNTHTHIERERDICFFWQKLGLHKIIYREREICFLAKTRTTQNYIYIYIYIYILYILIGTKGK